MAISTYAELQTAVANWLHRDDLTSRIPEFITIGEARIGREVRARQMEARVSTTPTSTYEDLPSDFVAIRAIRIKGSTVGWLDYMTPDKFFGTFASTTSATNKVYTIFGDELVFPSTPNGDIELWYYKKLAALSSGTNTLFTANPDLYLYASLCAAAPFVANDKRLVTWEALYKATKDAVNVSHENGRFPAGLAMVSA